MIDKLLLLVATAAQTIPAPTPAPPPVAIAQASDPARLAAAEKLIIVMHLDDQYESIFSHMVPVMTVQIMSTLGDNAKLPPQIRGYFIEPATRDKASRIFAEEAMKGFRSRFADLRKATAREYALAFTADELSQIAAFYASPVGVKALTTLPALQTKLMPIGMVVGREVGATAIVRTFERLGLDQKKPKT